MRTAAKAYIRIVQVLGGGIVAWSLSRVVADGSDTLWLIIAGMTVFTGWLTLRFPGIRSYISPAEPLIFTNVILFGPAAGAITASLDGLLSSMQFQPGSRRREHALFNASVLALSVYLAGEVFFLIQGTVPLGVAAKSGVAGVLIPAGLMGLVHYLFNSLATATVVSLEQGVSFRTVWVGRYLPCVVNYVASGVAAVLVALEFVRGTPTVISLLLLLGLGSYALLRVVLHWGNRSARAA